MANQHTGGGPPMVKIDGSKARSIRENQGLTQLYVATAVGVTTDTISRWENNRYPAIKRENCLKLAEALEVDISDLLQTVDKETADAPEEDTPAAPAEQPEEPVAAPASPGSDKSIAVKKSSKRFTIFLVTLLVGLGTIGGWFFLFTQKASLTAVRHAPAHFIPGTPFPVVIEIITEDEPSLSYVVKEQIPQRASVISTLPEIHVDKKQLATLKWLNKNKMTTRYAYTLTTASETTGGLAFNGSVSAKDQPNIIITGQTSSEPSTFHWADSDSNGRISDQEIMQAYNRYATVPDLHFELIEEIWMGTGYRFDEKSREIIIF